MSAHPGVGGAPLTRADHRTVRSNCWRCRGLGSIWPGSQSFGQGNVILCPGCAGTGLEMIPWTELFIHDPNHSRRRGFQKWSEIKKEYI